MKKLALALVTLSTLVATPVFACPMQDHDKQETADQNKKADDGSAKTADKQKSTDKAADKAKDAKPAPAKPVAKG